MPAKTIVIGAALAVLAGYLAPGYRRFTTVTGIGRVPENTHVEGPDFFAIDDTIQCEDLHHHLASGLLFAACEDQSTGRYSWFPPVANFDDPLVTLQSRGSIHVIDPKTFKSKRLEFENFHGPFVTHGIDVVSDVRNPAEVFILAVNHVPHADYLLHHQDKKPEKEYPGEAIKSHSRIEIFHHVLGSSKARHVRTVRDPLINTPNDIFAVSPTSFYVTNDHHYAGGHMRTVEDLYFGATWSNIIHVQVDDLQAKDPGAGINATVALTGLHMNNGLSHGRTGNEIAIGCAISGTFYLGTVSSDRKIELTKKMQVASSVDNPSYFVDPYARADLGDSSGFLLAGLTRTVDLTKSLRNPSVQAPAMVWHVKPNSSEPIGWDSTLVFEDDGSKVNTGTTAVLVGIDPKLEGGKKKAWLFVTGFIADGIVAAKVDL